MKIAITGTGGRLGRALADHLADQHEVLELPRARLDLGAAGLEERLEELDFELLLNPAAMTSLEACEEDPELAERVNALAPGVMAAVCARRSCGILHFSTDYVLGGEVAGLHGEDEAVDPRSVYGRTKARSEAVVLGAGGCVVRVSWLFGPERPAFPDQVVAGALKGEVLEAVADKSSLPTYTRDLVGWVEGLIGAGCPNEVIHACNGGEPASWHEVAEFLVDGLVARGLLEARPVVGAQALDEVAAFRAVRPRHSAMSTGRLAELLGRAPRDWREALADYLERYLISR